MPFTAFSPGQSRSHASNPTQRRRFALQCATLSLGLALGAAGILGFATHVEQPMWMYGRALETRIAFDQPTGGDGAVGYIAHAAPGTRVEMWCKEPGFTDWHVGFAIADARGDASFPTRDCSFGALTAYTPYLARPIQTDDATMLGLPLALFGAIAVFVAVRARRRVSELDWQRVSTVSLCLGALVFALHLVLSVT
jgi:hypothetical protein